MKTNKIKLFKKIYFDPSNPASFGSPELLYHEAVSQDPSVSLHDVKNWLSSQDTYTIHRDHRSQKRNRIVANTIDELWEADLVDMQEFAEYNDNFKYLLCVIDVLSKYAWVVPLKTKASLEVVKSFEKIFKQGRKPNKLRTDRGKEFKNKDMENLTKQEKIYHYFTTNFLKACVVERFNRTLKTKMWKYFSANYTFKYIDVLDELVEGYNSKKHSRTRFAPKDVNIFNSHQVFLNLYNDTSKATYKKPSNINVGDYVRLVKDKGVFEKGFTGHFLEEIFRVKQIITSKGHKPMYKLEDLEGEEIMGCHYRFDLQPVHLKKDNLFVVEKILKTRKRNGKKEYFCKWWGYSDKFNSWVDKIESIPKEG